jgi:endonuclease-3
MTLKERYDFVIRYFEETRPDAETELIYKNPFELIVAVILSAQCTDKRVNIITPTLLEKFPDPRTMADADPMEIFELIKTCSYPNSKSRYLSEMSKKLISEFNGIVPSERKELERLPGVGRKTANVISSVVFNKPYMAVDTHVFRVSARIGLTINAKNPLEAELQLTRHFPSKIMTKAHHWLILHGRYVCKAKKPECNNCGLTKCCNFYNKKPLEK